MLSTYDRWKLATPEDGMKHCARCDTYVERYAYEDHVCKEDDEMKEVVG